MITTLDVNTALVLIDLQHGIVQGTAANGSAAVVANAVLLANAFREKNLPVVILNVNPGGAAWTKARVDQPMPAPSPKPDGPTAADPLPTDIVETLAVEPGDIRITKHTWNAFFETGLHTILQGKKITGIVLGGISTSAGVEGTARAASELGYNISFATDAMTDRLPEAHANSIQFVFPRIGQCGSTTDILHEVAKHG